MSTLPPDDANDGTPPPPPPPSGGYGDYGSYGGTPPPPPPVYGAGAALPGGLVPAQWIQRVLAYLIDVFAPVIAVWIVAAIFGAISSTLGTLVGLLGWLAVLAWVVYNYGFKQGTTGYTLGKGIVGIKLVDATTGQPVGFGLAVARYFVHILDALPCYIGFLWPLWDARRETFADKILKHAVVEAAKVDPKSFIPDQLK